MQQEEKYINLFKSCEKFHSTFTLETFVQFCIEWDAACNRIKKYYERGRRDNG